MEGSIMWWTVSLEGQRDAACSKQNNRIYIVHSSGAARFFNISNLKQFNINIPIVNNTNLHERSNKMPKNWWPFWQEFKVPSLSRRRPNLSQRPS